MMSRSGRGWGPFSGGQLTTMVCVIVAAVAFPVAASAVTASKVFVTDATSGTTAKVSTAGAVSVAGSVTSKLKGSTSGNKAEVTNAQQLLTAEAPLSASVTGTMLALAQSTEPVLNLSSGHAIIVTSVTLSAQGPTGSGPFASLYVSSDSTCASSSTRDVGEVFFPSGVNSTSVLPFAAGVPVPDGVQLCVLVSSVNVVVSYDGYTVPAAAINTPIKKALVPHTHP
jgi:hypothetical protein